MRDVGTDTLTEALVRNAAPTLTGVMPANLFTVPGRFVARTEAEAAEVSQARDALERQLASCARELAPAGVALRLMVWRGCGALVYAYRPALLARHLHRPAAALPLIAAGYPAWDPERCLDRLAARIAARGKSAVLAGDGAPLAVGSMPPCTGCRRAADFPHEVGYLLGYPPADVAGFIRSRGQGYVLLGPWKVYADPAAARRTFARIHESSARCLEGYRRGGGLAELAAACA